MRVTPSLLRKGPWLCAAGSPDKLQEAVNSVVHDVALDTANTVPGEPQGCTGDGLCTAWPQSHRTLSILKATCTLIASITPSRAGTPYTRSEPLLAL